MRIFIQRCYIIFILLNIPACSSLRKNYSVKQSDLILTVAEKTKTKDNLSFEEISEDIEILKYALNKAYGGVRIHSKSVIERVETELEKINGSMSPERFCEFVAKSLFLIPDGHINIALNNKSCVRRDRVVKNVGYNLNKSKKNWAIFSKKEKNKNILIIAISSFPPGLWPGFEVELKKQIKKAQVIVIDLRGNGGGDDLSGKCMADIIAGQEVNEPVEEGVQRQSPEALIIWMNYLNVVKKMILENAPNNKAALESTEGYLSKAKAELELANAGTLEEFKIVRTQTNAVGSSKGIAFKGKIFILQDRKCFSSCESTIDFFEYLPNVTRVGDNTGGMIQFGNVGVFKLKNSGIGIQMPTKANIYKDKRFVELVGIAPNISVEDGKDAYETVLGIL